MSPAKKRLTSLFVLLLILFLAVGISSALYYFKTERNEEYQNRLHLRELKFAAQTLERNFDQFKYIGDLLNKISARENQQDVGKNSEFSHVMERAKQSHALQNLVQLTRRKNCWFSPSAKITHVSKHEDYTLNYNACDGKSFSAPLQDFFPEKLSMFPLVVVVNQKGEIIGRRDYPQNSTKTNELGFENMNGLVSQIAIEEFLLGLKRSDLSRSQEQSESIFKDRIPEDLTHSGILETAIGGMEFRIFSQPMHGFLENEGGTHQIIGFVPSSQFQLNKLKVSPNSGIWLLAAVLMLFSFIPLIKIRFLGKSQNYARSDIAFLLLGGAVFMGVFSLTVNHLIYEPQIEEYEQHQLTHLLKRFSTQFSLEIQFANAKADQMRKVIVGYATKIPSELPGTCEVKAAQAEERRVEASALNIVNCEYENLGASFKGPMTPFLESGFLAGEDALVRSYSHKDTAGDDDWYRMPILRAGVNNHNFSDFWLGEREYFQKTIKNRAWKLEHCIENTYKWLDCDETRPETLESGEPVNQSLGFYIQRIRNLTDGRLSSQFAFTFLEKETGVVEVPEQGNTKALSGPSYNVLGIGARLRTFFSPILPADVGYAVIDRRGRVFYHVDSDRVLTENFLVETNDNPIVTSLLSQTLSEPVEFRTVYRNTKHLMVMSDLHPDIPWKLVLFHDTQPAQSVVFWLYALSIGLFLQLAIFFLVYCWVGTYRAAWMRLFYYCKNKRRHYRQVSRMVIGLTLLFFVSLGFVVELLPRLAFWSLACAAVLLILARKFETNDTGVLENVPLYRQGFFPFLLFGIVNLAVFLFLLIEKVTLADSFEVSLSHVLMFLVGIITFVLFWKFERLPKTFRKRIQPVIGRLLPKPVSVFGYSVGYITYLCALSWLFIVVPALLIGNSANHLVLDFMSDKDRHAMIASCEKQREEKKSYFAAFGMSESLQDGCTLANNQIQARVWSGAETNKPGWVKSRYTPIKPDWLLLTMLRFPAVADSLQGDFLQFVLKPDSHYSQWQNGDFQLTALMSSWYIIFLFTPLLFMISFAMIKHIIAHRLLGEHLLAGICFDRPMDEENDLADDAAERKSAPWGDRLASLLSAKGSVRIQLIRADEASVIEELDKQSIQTFKQDDRLIFRINDILEQIGGEFSFAMSVKAEQKRVGGILTVVISDLEALFLRKSDRQKALALLNGLSGNSQVNIILLCEMSMLYRLTNQQAYPHTDADQWSETDETLGWSSLFARFDKLIAWAPECKPRLIQGASPLRVLLHETRGWPELSGLFHQFGIEVLGIASNAATKQGITLHQAVRVACDKMSASDSPVSSSQPHETMDSQYDAYVLHLFDSELEGIKSLAPEQIVSFFSSRAGTLYRHKWNQCTLMERIMMLQLAQGMVPNPANSDTLEYLAKRGYLYRDQGWFFVNESFRQFVLTAEKDTDVNYWMAQTSAGTWEYIRIPIFVVLLVLIGVFLLSSGQSIESMLATLTATLGLLPVVLRNLNIFRGSD